MSAKKYKIGDRVVIRSVDWYNTHKNKNEVVNLEDGFGIYKEKSVWCGKIMTVCRVLSDCYLMEEDGGEYYWTDTMIEKLAIEDESDMGEVSDGYHTFNELYEYRLLYNASMFNELAKQNLYDVHKSKRHSDGEVPFGDSNWFIVMAELPTGQISNHYEMKDWDLFQIPEKEKANGWDGHTPKDVAERLRKFLTPQPKYPQTYEECCGVLGFDLGQFHHTGTNGWYKWRLISELDRLLLCRDAYWKIAGEMMGLGKPWIPDWNTSEPKYVIAYTSRGIEKQWETTYCKGFAFPTEEMRDAFYENFNEEIEICKELL